MAKYGVVLYLLALMVYVIAGVPVVPFHGDESTLIYGTRDYFEQFVTPDMPRIMNQRDDDGMDQQLRLLDGRVQTYFGGFVYHLSGGTQAGLNQPWLWGASAQHNLDNGHVPPRDLLLTHRYATAVLLAVSIPAAYGIGAHVGGLWGGLLMATLVAVSPNTLINGRRAMMEAPLLLFSLLTVLAALRIAAYQRLPLIRLAPVSAQESAPDAARASRLPLFFILLGLASGMALSSKHTAVYTLVPVFGALGLWLAQRRDWRRLVWLVAAGIAALAIYLLMNPAWWASPVETGRRMLDMRADLLANQRAAFGGYADFGGNVGGFIDFVLLERPQYFEVADWEEIGATIAEYESSPWVLSPLMNLIRAAVTAALAILGAWGLLRRRDALGWLMLVWIGFTLATVFVLTPLPWARYYLPALPAIYALAAAGLGEIVRWRRQI